MLSSLQMRKLLTDFITVTLKINNNPRVKAYGGPMIYSHCSQEKDGICFRKIVTVARPQSENRDNPDTPRLHLLKPWETEAETQVQPVSRRGD